MKAFLYGVALQWKLSLRNREVLIVYYLVPLVFFLFMGGVLTSIMPGANETLIASMTVFGVTMGGVLGMPAPLVAMYSTDMKKAYQVGGVPLWTAAASSVLSGFAHLFVMSLVIFFAAPVLFDAAVPQNLPAYFIALALLILASLCTGLVFGLVVKSAAKLSMVTQIIFLPSVLLSGIMFPASMLPAVLRGAGKLLFASWSFEAMCSPVVDAKLLLPLAGLILLPLAISAWRLNRIKAE